MKKSTKQISHVGLYISFCAVIGWLLLLIPNVELITLFIFYGGFLFGPVYGMFIGFTAEFVFSAFNPLGSGLAFLPLLAGQVAAMTVIGMCGGMVNTLYSKPALKKIMLPVFGACGFFLTLLFHFSLLFSTFIFAGFSFEQLKLTAAVGSLFSAWHIISNTVFFYLLMPLLIRVSHNLGLLKSANT